MGVWIAVIIKIVLLILLSTYILHNAKVLLFLEEMEEQGKRVILIDDNYDSLYSDDDIIGIKTWDNERMDCCHHKNRPPYLAFYLYFTI